MDSDPARRRTSYRMIPSALAMMFWRFLKSFYFGPLFCTFKLSTPSHMGKERVAIASLFLHWLRPVQREKRDYRLFDWIIVTSIRSLLSNPSTHDETTVHWRAIDNTRGTDASREQRRRGGEGEQLSVSLSTNRPSDRPWESCKL